MSKREQQQQQQQHYIGLSLTSMAYRRRGLSIALAFVIASLCSNGSDPITFTRHLAALVKAKRDTTERKYLELQKKWCHLRQCTLFSESSLITHSDMKEPLIPSRRNSNDECCVQSFISTTSFIASRCNEVAVDTETVDMDDNSLMLPMLNNNQRTVVIESIQLMISSMRDVFAIVVADVSAIGGILTPTGHSIVSRLTAAIRSMSVLLKTHYSDVHFTNAIEAGLREVSAIISETISMVPFHVLADSETALFDLSDKPCNLYEACSGILSFMAFRCTLLPYILVDLCDNLFRAASRLHQRRQYTAEGPSVSLEQQLAADDVLGAILRLINGLISRENSSLQPLSTDITYTIQSTCDETSHLLISLGGIYLLIADDIRSIPLRAYMFRHQ